MFPVALMGAIFRDFKGYFLSSDCQSSENYLRNSAGDHRIPPSVNPVGPRITSQVCGCASPPGLLRAHQELKLLCVVVCTEDDRKKNATHSAILISIQSQKSLRLTTAQVFKPAGG
jgi:hypothetical protein